VNKFSHLRFEPAGFTGNRDIPMAKSLVDYIFRYMASKFMSQTDKDAAGVINRQLTLADAKVVSGEATSGTTGTPDGAPSVPAVAQPLTDSASTRSAVTDGSTSGNQPLPSTEATSSGDAAQPAANFQVGGETVSAKPETVANGLLDGLKIVAQNSVEKDRAERLAVGQAPVVFDTADSPACTDCGSIMVRNGSCYKCINCGATSGCS
jgi:ribonucleoside-diphosphate reductase alpha chain